MTIPHEIAQRVFSRNRQERELLKANHLVIVGLGSVGSALALMAARAGLNRFTLIDIDQLEPENIGRHFCDLNALGKSKVKAVKELIAGVNPEAEVEALAEDFRTMDRSGIASQLNDNTLLVGATDSFQCQSLVNLLSQETGTPSLFVGCWGEAAVGEILYVVPGKTACFECYAGFRRKTEELSLNDPRKYTDLDFDQTKMPAQAGLWPNILIICGFAFQAMLGLWGLDRKRQEPLIDFCHTLFLVNVGDPNSELPLWAVTSGTVKQGCGVCDPGFLPEALMN